MNTQTQQKIITNIINELCGKYKNELSSSEEFSNRRKEEKLLED